MSKMVLSLKNISKHYKQGNSIIKVLDNISFSVNKGDTLSITGASGSGKSTLLHIAGLLDFPNFGEVFFDNESYTKNNDLYNAAKVRLNNMGFIYQYHHLLRDFTAQENAAMPLLINNISKREAMDRSATILEQLGLSKRLNNMPGELSGGEQQRVAIARSLVNNPRIILADEPTGNLDPNTAEDVFSMFLERVKKDKVAIIMVSHNLGLASRMQRYYHLTSGKLQELAR